MFRVSTGYYVPSLETLAQYHPQVALAVWNGVPLRPNLRPLSVELQNSMVGNPQVASFSTIVSEYSIFAGLDVTIDPTNNLTGNPLKYLSDAAQPLTSGITTTLLVQSSDGVNYSPVPDDTPLQSIPIAFGPAVGTWSMRRPENLKQYFTLQTQAEGETFTVWAVYTFLVLSHAGRDYLEMSVDTARARLQAIGLLPKAA